MKVKIGSVGYTCGLKYVGYFYDGYDPFTKQQISQYGTGFFVAGFINNKKCKKAYEYFCEKTTLVYQSPVRRNRNTDNDFFFCIFDVK